LVFSGVANRLTEHVFDVEDIVLTSVPVPLAPGSDLTAIT